ncbi:hypothetical protein NMG60_11036741 [Bertholletia excelsa]
MALRARTTPSDQTPPSTDTSDSPKPQASVPLSLSQRTLASTAHLANLLPTGTLLAFQLLTPIFTNNGSCDAATRPLTLLLLGLLAVSCFLACFTDSFKSRDGQVFYGFVTPKGMWLFDSPAAEAAGLPDLRKYKLRAIDVIHAMLSLLVFAAVALRDRNVLGCLYPSPGHEAKEVLDIVPIGIGLICSLLFVVFPTRRHGIGYPVTP